MSGQYRALLDVARIIAAHRDFPSLLEALTVLLHTLAPFDYLSLMIYDPEQDLFCVIYPGLPSRSIPRSCGFGFEDGPGGWVWEHQRPLVCDIEEIEESYPKIATRRHEQSIVSSCVVPLTTAVRKVGVLEFLSTHRDVYREEDVEFMEQVGSQVAVAVDNALHHESARMTQERISTLLDVSTAVVSSLDLQELLTAVSKTIERVLGAGYCSLVLHDPKANVLRCMAVHSVNRQSKLAPGRIIPVEDTPMAQAFKRRQPVNLCEKDLHEATKISPHAAQAIKDGIRCICLVPLVARGRVIGVLSIGHLGKEVFNDAEVQLLLEIANQISVSVDNARAYVEITHLKDTLSTEKLYLEEEIRTAYNFKEMIGESEALKRVHEQIAMVAASDATVLILGETGTGKELVARAIHDMSQRKSRTLVKLNCASVPSGLLESDLFGHEKGAFTGAIAQKIGRFELANNGTLFLDEIGDLPLELQPKLLRAIQEGEIERLGCARSFKVNVRLIAATHRDLDQMIAHGEFRRDLFYRLNVFPIVLPPLRERVEDIPLLVRYFTAKYAKQLGKHIESIPSETMEILKSMPWPGNIRELENLIERGVIVTHGQVLQVPLTEPHPAENTLLYSSRFHKATVLAEPPRKEDHGERDAILEALRECKWRISGPNGAAEKLAMSRSEFLSATQRLRISLYPQGVGEQERDLIMRTLRECNGQIAGQRGAAARLGLNRTTLYSRMQRLGIPKNF